MSDVPSVPKRIQIEEVRFRAPVSESTSQKLGGTMNYILDHFVIPEGSIMAYAGIETGVPSGWHICDGRTLSRTTYANLFAAIGTYWGAGNGFSTFTLPDLRGAFLRMVDKTLNGQKGRDPNHAGRTPTGTGTTEDSGSYQADDFANHGHNYGGTGGAGSNTSVFLNPADSFDSYQYGSSLTGGAETRPKNLYVFYIIKD